MAASSFRAAIERRDIDAAVGLLAENVVFRSPAVFKPYEGRATVETILRTRCSGSSRTSATPTSSPPTVRTR